MPYDSANQASADVSVIICTWNRCLLLERTLRSLASLIIPAGVEWEVLVVDNGCTDQTREVLSACSRRLPLRVVHEPVLGVSPARNAGARAAHGELLLFTDDDVRLDRDWLSAYWRASRRWPEAEYFGGEILPEFQSPPPQWVAGNLGMLHGMLGSRDLGREQRELQPSEVPYGPNMALRRTIFDTAEFDERVGRRGCEQVRYGETSIFFLLAGRGARGVWVPEAKVQHYVPDERCNFGYFWNLYAGLGRAEYRLGRHVHVRPRRRLAKSLLKTMVKLCLGRSDWVENLARAARSVGQILEAREQARSGLPQPPGRPKSETSKPQTVL